MSNVAVVVIGDFGRSPRMQYHSLSLAESHTVSVVASRGSAPIHEIQEHPNIRLYLMEDLKFEKFPRILRYGLKAVYQTLMLLITLLFIIPKPKSILVQNPPSVPTLPCVWLACRLRSASFILDWHNYGYSILGLSAGKASLITKAYRWIEFYFGAKADRNFCVSDAMKRDLQYKGIRDIVVLHDKPPKQFRPMDWDNPEEVERVHSLLLKLGEQPGLGDLRCGADETAITKRTDGHLERRADRPFLLFSSTSWTADEDFGVLLSALQKYDEGPFPKILCIVTGKGPLKDFYLEQISRMTLTKVKFLTPWLDIEDYPLMVSICDLGVCLHTSSSSLDLPMKIVDMFGCCVPVLACKYRCIEELVRPEDTGLLFENADELCAHILRMVHDKVVLAKWRQKLRLWQTVRWTQNWNNLARPIFNP